MIQFLNMSISFSNMSKLVQTQYVKTWWNTLKLSKWYMKCFALTKCLDCFKQVERSKMKASAVFFRNIEYQVIRNAPSKKISLNFATTGLEHTREERKNWTKAIWTVHLLLLYFHGFPDQSLAKFAHAYSRYHRSIYQ